MERLYSTERCHVDVACHTVAQHKIALKRYRISTMTKLQKVQAMREGA